MNNRFLTASDVMARAPSVFATHPSTSTSESFSFIPTIDIIRRLDSAGFGVTYAGQAKTKKQENEGFQKHIVRMRSRNAELSGAKAAPEIVLINSHSGTSSFRLLKGFFSFVCSNGLIVGTDVEEALTIRHSQENAFEQSVLGLMELHDSARSQEATIARWAAMPVSQSRIRWFGNHVMRLRVTNEDAYRYEENAVAFTTPRRDEERKPTLWNLLNVAQEAAIRGGMRMRTGRYSVTRELQPVEAIDKAVHINREVWKLAELAAKQIMEGATV